MTSRNISFMAAIMSAVLVNYWLWTYCFKSSCGVLIILTPLSWMLVDILDFGASIYTVILRRLHRIFRGLGFWKMHRYWSRRMNRGLRNSCHPRRLKNVIFRRNEWPPSQCAVGARWDGDLSYSLLGLTLTKECLLAHLFKTYKGQSPVNMGDWPLSFISGSSINQRKRQS